jgi:hypothetical protein
MASLNDIKEALDRAIPTHLQHETHKLAEYLYDAIAEHKNSIGVQQEIPASSDMKDLVAALSGFKFRVESSVVSFGSGLQAGDINIENIAGGDIYKITVNIQNTSSQRDSDTLIEDATLNDMWRRADEAILENNFEYAERLLIRIEKASPGFKNVKGKLAETRAQSLILKSYRELCQLEDARWTDVKTGLAILELKYPNFVDTNNLRGWVQIQETKAILLKEARMAISSQRWEDAQVALYKIIRDNPQDSKAKDMLQKVNDKIHQKKEAESRLANSKIESINSHDEDYHNQVYRYEHDDKPHILNRLGKESRVTLSPYKGTGRK